MAILNLFPPIVKVSIPNTNVDALQSTYNSLVNAYNNLVADANSKLTVDSTQIQGLIAQLNTTVPKSIYDALNINVNGLNGQIDELKRQLQQARLTPAPTPTPTEPNSLYDNVPAKFHGRQDIHAEPVYPAKAGLIPNYRLGQVLMLPNDPIQQNTPFQPQDRMAFSPLPSEPYSVEGLMLLGVVANFARTKEGMKSLERLMVKYLDSCTTIISSVQDACHSNWLTALNNQHITAAISHRIGLIDDAGYLKIIDHYRSVFDKMFLLSAVDGTITGVTTLVQGAKVGQSSSSERSDEGTSRTKESSSEGIGALATVLKALV